MLKNLKILRHQGTQYLPDLTSASPGGRFMGRPVISREMVDEEALVNLCPTSALSRQPFSLDLGKCVFCGACSLGFPNKISFTGDHRMASDSRKQLVVVEGVDEPIGWSPEAVRTEIRKYFSHSLKLRQVCAGGDNSNELELNACGNVNFDFGRYGIEFVASPRHADGIVITGPITRNMSQALQICYDAMADPKLIILAGTEAISGGILADSPALDRSFLDRYRVDLYVPGSPIHPLTFIHGLLRLMGKIS
ncbi:MAG: NADH-quinone oxidoreductase subunit B family protein [Chitinophagaceae bacterium]